MRIAHLLNVLARHSAQLANLVQELGAARGLIRFIRQTPSAPWLDRARLEQRLCPAIANFASQSRPR